MASLDRRPSGAWRLRWRFRGQMQVLHFEEIEQDAALRAKAMVDLAPRNTMDEKTVFATVLGRSLLTASKADPVDERPVAAFVPGYLDSLLEVESRTRRDNRGRLERSVLPRIGMLPAVSIDSTHIDQIMNDLKQRGLEKRTLDRYYNCMKGLFTFLVRTKVRTTNPVKEINYKPQSLAKYNVGRKEDLHFYMTKEQYMLLRSHFKPEDHLLLDLLVQTGARWGEATAVKVQAVKLRPGQHPEVDLCEAWKEDEHGAWYVGPPKAGSNRVVPIRHSMVTKLQPLLAGKRKTALVFQAPDGGRVIYHVFQCRWDNAVTAAMRCALHPPAPEGHMTDSGDLAGPRCGDNGGLNKSDRPCRQWVSPGWDRCSGHLGVPADAESTCECWDRRLPKRPSIHDLRHTHVAWLIAAGTISVKAISMRLGHASTVVTEKVYAGLLREIDDKIIDAIAIGDEDEDQSLFAAA